MSLDKEKPLFSSHIFMFPFRFDWVGKDDIKDNKSLHEFNFYASKDIKKRISLKTLHKLLESSDWKYEKFEMKGDDKNLLYSEYAYFYDYARDSIYNLDDFSENAISYFYRKKNMMTKYLKSI